MFADLPGMHVLKYRRTVSPEVRPTGSGILET